MTWVPLGLAHGAPSLLSITILNGTFVLVVTAPTRITHSCTKGFHLSEGIYRPRRFVSPYAAINQGIQHKTVHFVAHFCGLGLISEGCILLSVVENIRDRSSMYYYPRDLRGLRASECICTHVRSHTHNFVVPVYDATLAVLYLSHMLYDNWLDSIQYASLLYVISNGTSTHWKERQYVYL